MHIKHIRYSFQELSMQLLTKTGIWKGLNKSSWEFCNCLKSIALPVEQTLKNIWINFWLHKIYKVPHVSRQSAHSWEIEKRRSMRMTWIILSKPTKPTLSSFNKTSSDSGIKIWITNAFKFFIHGPMNLIQLISNISSTTIW